MIVGFIRSRLFGGRVKSVSLGIVEFSRWVHVDASWAWSGSFGFIPARPGVVWCITARPVGRLVHSGSLDSFRRALGVVGLILVRCVYSGDPLCSCGCAQGVVGFIGVRWVQSCAAWVFSC